MSSSRASILRRRPSPRAAVALRVWRASSARFAFPLTPAVPGTDTSEGGGILRLREESRAASARSRIAEEKSMQHLKMASRLVAVVTGPVVIGVLLLAHSAPVTGQTQSSTGATVFEGARLIVGD